MSIQLRGGQITKNIKLDRILNFDPRSKNFKAKDLIENDHFKSMIWHTDTHLDQGREGACVGFGFAHEASARPVQNVMYEDTARKIYKLAQKHDRFEGEDYEGADVLGGAKAMRLLGYIDSFYWCFSIEDVILALSWLGPVVIGIAWTEDMYQPDVDGFIHPTGKVVGGHCLLVKGVILGDTLESTIFILHNSWGIAYGLGGDCLMRGDALAALLKQQGEAVVAHNRQKINVTTLESLSLDELMGKAA